LQGKRLVAETGADGNLVTALGTAAAEDGGACLGLHTGKEAVGLGAVTAVGLEGTLRHDKNSCGRRGLPLKLLAIAAISEYTRWDGIFPENRSALFSPSTICRAQKTLGSSFGLSARSFVRKSNPPFRVSFVFEQPEIALGKTTRKQSRSLSGFALEKTYIAM
jgi:hypothetical protein